MLFIRYELDFKVCCEVKSSNFSPEAFVMVKTATSCNLDLRFLTVVQLELQREGKLKQKFIVQSPFKLNTFDLSLVLDYSSRHRNFGSNKICYLDLLIKTLKQDLSLKCSAWKSFVLVSIP